MLTLDLGLIWNKLKYIDVFRIGYCKIKMTDARLKRINYYVTIERKMEIHLWLVPQHSRFLRYDQLRALWAKFEIREYWMHRFHSSWKRNTTKKFVYRPGKLMKFFKTVKISWTNFRLWKSLENCLFLGWIFLEFNFRNKTF